MKIDKVPSFVILLCLFIIGFIFTWDYFHTHKTKEEIYYFIGPIAAEDEFELPTKAYPCVGSRPVPLGFYASAHSFNIYKGSKYRFKKFIEANYQNNNYKNSGYLNLRFLINCHADIYQLEVNAIDYNFNTTTFKKELVDQIISLVLQSDNWDTSNHKNENYYMYLNFKLNNGNIIEIIP